MDEKVIKQFSHITKWFTKAEIKQLCTMLIAQDLDDDDKINLISTLMKIKNEVKINE
tara:strand:+ start:675 stop:845 length:171 start_codon:yes stop_codon:yes gene_type:complete